MKKLSLSRPIILIPILLILLLGCGKDDPAIPQLKDDLYLSKIFVDGKLYREINYDAAKRIESIKYYENGQLDMSRLWEYNEKGEVAKKWSTDSDGSFQGVTTYEYDGGGKLIKSLAYDNIFEDPKHGTTYEYDGNGKVVSAEYHFVPSKPDQVQTYNRYEYDIHDNLTVQKYYVIKPYNPDVLYYEEYLLYNDPQKTAAIREKIGGTPYGMMYLYSSTEVTNYKNDGSGDIGYAYSIEVDTEYDPQGWPVQSTVSAVQTHPQHDEGSAVITYEYIEL